MRSFTARSALDKQKGVRGGQYLSICYTERLAEAGMESSVGSVGDSYDNALAETINASTRQKSFVAAVPGVTLMMWSMRRWNGSTGLTTAGCWSLSAMCRQGPRLFGMVGGDVCLLKTGR